MKDFLSDYFKKTEVEFIEKFPISTISKIGIGGTVSFAVWPNTEHQLTHLSRFLYINKIPYKIVGSLSNILPRDEHLNIVLIITSKLNKFEIFGNKIEAECGVSFSKLLLEAAKSNLGGAEGLIGIPGTVGGMIFMNAGAYGLEISSFIENVTVFSPISNSEYTLSKEKLGFSYRHSNLQKSNLLLLHSELKFSKKNNCEIIEEFNKIISLRKLTQPIGSKSLGSVFKKNDNIAASQLIDSLGLKGINVGGASVSEKHAGFIINSGKATASDVRALIKLIKEKVFNSYGILLQEEIEFL